LLIAPLGRGLNRSIDDPEIYPRRPHAIMKNGREPRLIGRPGQRFRSLAEAPLMLSESECPLRHFDCRKPPVRCGPAQVTAASRPYWSLSRTGSLLESRHPAAPPAS
jgi:hypothetical protein